MSTPYPTKPGNWLRGLLATTVWSGSDGRLCYGAGYSVTDDGYWLCEIPSAAELAALLAIAARMEENVDHGGYCHVCGERITEVVCREQLCPGIVDRQVLAALAKARKEAGE